MRALEKTKVESAIKEGITPETFAEEHNISKKAATAIYKYVEACNAELIILN